MNEAQEKRNPEQIYLDYHDKVTRFVTAKVGDSNVIEDLVADIFVKVYRHLDRFDEQKASLSTWIYTISGNTVYDYYRTRKVYSELPPDSGEEGQVPEYLIDRKEPLADTLKEEQLEELARALELLPQRERDLIILCYYHNLTLKVIAEKMGMSYANCKIVHKKALTHLRNQMNRP